MRMTEVVEIIIVDTRGRKTRRSVLVTKSRCSIAEISFPKTRQRLLKPVPLHLPISCKFPHTLKILSKILQRCSRNISRLRCFEFLKPFQHRKIFSLRLIFVLFRASEAFFMLSDQSTRSRCLAAKQIWPF